MSMSINPKGFVSACNLVGRPNVLLSKDLQDKATAGVTLQTQTQLFSALNPLVESKPNWRFLATGGTANVGNNAYVLTAFTILEDGETLGRIDIEYKRRDYKLMVDNDRITAKRERGIGYVTDDPTKATLAIRKHFFRLDKSERLTKAVEEAERVISGEFTDKSWTRNRTKSALFAEETKFTAAHLEQYMDEFPQMRQHHETYLQAKRELRLVKEIKESFDSKRGLLVVLDGTNYLVRVGESTTAYTNDTLPESMRGKIGILKLVEDRQMVSDVGCRINASTFVLLPEVEVKEQA
jgi:hypothetical protein